MPVVVPEDFWPLFSCDSVGAYPEALASGLTIEPFVDLHVDAAVWSLCAGVAAVVVGCCGMPSLGARD